VVQSAESRKGSNLAPGDRMQLLRRPTHRRVFRQPQMRAVMVIVADILSHEPFQMPCVQNNHMIQQVSSAASYPALRNPVLPWTTECGAHWQAPHPSRKRHHVIAKLRVAVEQQEFMDRSIGPGFSHLLRDPECVGISRDIEAKYRAPIMPDHEKAIKNAERKRQHGEKIHGGDCIPVIPQECQPAPTWILAGAEEADEPTDQVPKETDHGSKSYRTL